MYKIDLYMLKRRCLDTQGERCHCMNQWLLWLHLCWEFMWKSWTHFVSHASRDGFCKDKDDGKVKKGNTSFLAGWREEHIGTKVNFTLCFAFFLYLPNFKRCTGVAFVRSVNVNACGNLLLFVVSCLIFKHLETESSQQMGLSLTGDSDSQPHTC